MANEFVARRGLIAQNDSEITGSFRQGAPGNRTPGIYSHAEGGSTLASGDYSHAEGINTQASNSAAHAEGNGPVASGLYSHAEGGSTTATNTGAHSEGYGTAAQGEYSHAEGWTTYANGTAAHAEGISSTAQGNYSHAEGSNTTTTGNYSHTEGYVTEALGEYSHAEGNSTKTYGQFSHAEGYGTFTGTVTAFKAGDDTSISSGVITINSSYGDVTAVFAAGNPIIFSDIDYSNNYGIKVFTIDTVVWDSSNTIITLTDTSVSTSEANCGDLKFITAWSGYGGDRTIAPLYAHTEGNATNAFNISSHAEGSNTVAGGTNSHAEGYQTTAGGDNSHAEGRGTLSFGPGSHAEGYITVASGDYSHAEGHSTVSIGTYSHAEGQFTSASGNYSHAEGYYTSASGDYSHAEGDNTIAQGLYSHAEGRFTNTMGDYSHAEGYGTIARGNYSHAEGTNTLAFGDVSHTEGLYTTASANYSHAKGHYTIASGEFSHAEGTGSRAVGVGSHAEGWNTIASGSLSHAEGRESIALGGGSHAEGRGSIASGDFSHAEGLSTEALGSFSHAEGSSTIALGDASHAEGSQTIASASFSHAEGQNTVARVQGSHAEGYYTVAAGLYQHVQGQYNQSSSAQSAFIIGNGINSANRSNLVFASGSQFQVTGSVIATQGFTGSLFGTSSFASTASFAPLYLPLTGGTISGNLAILGTASFTYVSQSTLNIGTNLITVNTFNPTSRFGGLAVIDSGSSPLVSASLLYDSVQDEFICVHKGTSTSAITSSHFLLGPETFNNLGNETYLTANRIPKGTGIEHLNDSNISDNGSVVAVNSNTQITGSLNVTGNVGIGTTDPAVRLNVAGGDAAFDFGGFANIPAVKLLKAGDEPTLRFYRPSGGTPDARIFQIQNTVGDLTFGYALANKYSESTFTEAMRITAAGNVGIGTTSAPSFPLSFGTGLGNKIALYDAGSGNGYGFGIQPSLLQIFSNAVGDDITFGYGNSTSLTRNVTFKGTGNVGIGTTTPNATLDVTGSTIITGSLRGQVGALSIASNTASIDLSSNNFFTVNLVNGANTHISASNIRPGQTINLRVSQSSAGTGTVSFNSVIEQPSGSPYTGSMIPNAEDIVTFISFDSTRLYTSAIRNLV